MYVKNKISFSQKKLLIVLFIKKTSDKILDGTIPLLLTLPWKMTCPCTLIFPGQGNPSVGVSDLVCCSTLGLMFLFPHLFPSCRKLAALSGRRARLSRDSARR
jgi:hypothetical protein